MRRAKQLGAVFEVGTGEIRKPQRLPDLDVIIHALFSGANQQGQAATAAQGGATGGQLNSGTLRAKKQMGAQQRHASLGAEGGGRGGGISNWKQLGGYQGMGSVASQCVDDCLHDSFLEGASRAPAAPHTTHPAAPSHGRLSGGTDSEWYYGLARP